MTHRFCITHAEPLLPDSWYDDCIALGEFQAHSQFHVAQLDRFWHEARPLAYGAAGSHVLPVAVGQLRSDVRLIELSSYRKRVLPSPEGIEAPSYPTMRELSLRSLANQFELSVITPEADLEFLVSQPRYFEKAIIGQYAACHHRRDIIDYVSIAVELGVLDSRSGSDFLKSKHFVPGGVELGIYPRTWLVDTLTKIERVSKEFLIRNGERLRRYDAYQVRAVGFLSERLGSYFLIRELEKRYDRNIPAQIFGYMSVVVDEDLGYSIASTDIGKNRLRFGRSGRKQTR